jgi:hypothetical protein
LMLRQHLLQSLLALVPGRLGSCTSLTTGARCGQEAPNPLQSIQKEKPSPQVRQ